MSDPIDDLLPRPVTCPGCGDEQDCATSTEGGGRPKDGDFNVCLYCAAVSRFKDQKLEAFSEEEFAALGSELQFHIRKVQQAVRSVRTTRSL